MICARNIFRNRDGPGGSSAHTGAGRRDRVRPPTTDRGRRPEPGMPLDRVRVSGDGLA
jgi:hypothetical protein